MSQSTDGAQQEVLPAKPQDNNWAEWAANLTVAQREILHKLLTRDQETGFLNREHFMDLLRRELQRGRRYKRILSLAIVRMDNYETVLADKGPAAATALMKHAADSLQCRIRDIDAAGRYSPNEFLVLMPETDGMNGAMVASRICNGITGSEWSCEGEATALPVSVGVAAFPRDGKDWADLIFWARTDLEPHPC